MGKKDIIKANHYPPLLDISQKEEEKIKAVSEVKEKVYSVSVNIGPKEFIISQLYLLDLSLKLSKRSERDISNRLKEIDRALDFIRDNIETVQYQKAGDKGIKYEFTLTEEAQKNRAEVDLGLQEIFLTPGSPVRYIVSYSLYGEGIIRKTSKKQSKNHTKIAIHTVSQFYGDNIQLSLFSDEKIDAFSKATGLSITNRPNSYGVVLNQSQRRVLEGILKAFTDSDYKGDKEIDKATYSSNVYPVDKIAGAYSNVDKIPVVRLTQAQIIDLSGYDLKNQRQGDKQDVIEALSFLATNQFCFYWIRLKTENGKPVKDKSGDYVKEEVTEVGTLLRIKTVRDQTGLLQYYEVHPSAPLLDQVNNYFLLVPNNWRDEVKQLTGKRASSYTYELLLWLRLQYEQIRRYNKGGGKSRKPKPFKISKSWEEVAIALKMPETMYKANRKRASKIIQEAYSVAIKLGYLIKVENNGATDILYLNESYYPKPGELV